MPSGYHENMSAMNQEPEEGQSPVKRGRGRPPGARRHLQQEMEAVAVVESIQQGYVSRPSSQNGRTVRHNTYICAIAYMALSHGLCVICPNTLVTVWPNNMLFARKNI